MMKAVRSLLIVDDDEDDRALFREALYEINPAICCLVAENGTDALTFLNNTTNLPDLIFLDLNMPKINGKECLRFLKQDLQLKDIPVIVYSTGKTDADVSEIMTLGAVDYIQKPNCFEDIVREISECLSRVAVLFSPKS